jgi:hypothetical protein
MRLHVVDQHIEPIGLPRERMRRGRHSGNVGDIEFQQAHGCPLPRQRGDGGLAAIPVATADPYRVALRSQPACDLPAIPLLAPVTNAVRRSVMR